MVASRLSIPSLALLLAPVLVACGGGSPPPENPSTPTETKPKASAPDAGGGAANTGAADSAAVDKLTEEEAKSGTCDAEHKAALEKLLDQVETSVRAKTEDGKPLHIESFSKRTLPLSGAARGFSLTLTGKGTQVHVIAFSAKDVSLDALAAGAAATTMRSPFQHDAVEGGAKITIPKTSAPTALQTDSRQIEMKPGQALEVRLRGQGCAGVVVFSR